MTPLDRLADAVHRAVDVRLFTVLAWVPARRVLRRVHSSHPQEYPVGAEKVVGTDVDGGWLRCCVDEGRPYLGADVDAVRAVFADHALIAALGCGAVVNAPVLDAPVLDGGRVIGVLNVLGPEGSYDEDSVAAVMALAPLAVPALRGLAA